MDEGRPENAVQRIIVDPGNRDFEMRSPSLLYTAISRATTLGDNSYLHSAIYFTGKNITKRRCMNMTKTLDGRDTVRVIRRNRRVNVLDRNTIEYTPTEEEQASILQWIQAGNFNTTDLWNMIMG